MKCEKTKSHEGLDVHKIVHIAMEKCFVGEMVYLAFYLSNTCKNTSQKEGNMLPISKATNINTYKNLPEILANGICRVQNEKKQRCIANFFMDYLNILERGVLSGSENIFLGNDCSHSITYEENRISMNETGCGLDEVLSPCHFFDLSSNNNDLSLMPSENKSNSGVNVLKNLSSDLETSQRSVCFQNDQVEDVNCSESERISCTNENLTIQDLQQSFSYSAETNAPCMWTSIRNDNPNNELHTENPTAKDTLSLASKSVSDNLQPVRLSTNAVDVCSKFNGSKSGIPLNVEKTCDSLCETVDEGLSKSNRLKTNAPDLFDSLTSEDLDAFLADITWRPEPIDGNQNQSSYNKDKRCPHDTGETTSAANMVCCVQLQTCLTSTPSLRNSMQHKTSSVEGAFGSTFSPIYSEFTPALSKRRSFLPCDGIIPTAAKQSKFSLSSPLSSCNIAYQKSSSNVSSTIKAKKKSKNLLKCMLSSENLSCSSDNSQLNALDASQENPGNSPDPCTRLVQRDTAPREKWTEHSLLLFEDSSASCGSKEENIKSNLTNRGRACLGNNIFDEKFLSTCSSPSLFSP